VSSSAWQYWHAGHHFFESSPARPAALHFCCQFWVCSALFSFAALNQLEDIDYMRCAVSTAWTPYCTQVPLGAGMHRRHTVPLGARFLPFACVWRRRRGFMVSWGEFWGKCFRCALHVYPGLGFAHPNVLFFFAGSVPPELFHITGCTQLLVGVSCM
jgi:hypothetical protein